MTVNGTSQTVSLFVHDARSFQAKDGTAYDYNYISTSRVAFRRTSHGELQDIVS